MNKVFIFILISVSIYSQNNNEYLNRVVVNADASLVVPVGRLSSKFKNAQSYGLWVTLGQEKNIYCDLGLSLLLLNDARDINYRHNDSIYNITSNNFGLEFGMEIANQIAISKNTIIKAGTLLGMHYLDYKFPDEEGDKKNKGPYYFKNTTFIFAPQVRIFYKNIGLKIQYRFTPYSMIEEFDSKFGSQSVLIGIAYRQ